MFGDFLLNPYVANSRYGLLKAYAGPTAEPVTEAFGVVGKGLQGEGGESLEHMGNLLKSLTPSLGLGQDLLLNTLFLRSLGDLGGDRRSRARIRKRMKEHGYRYYAD